MYREKLTLKELLALKPKVTDKTIYEDIQQNWDLLSKPIDGFGDFEKVICRIGAVQGKRIPLLDKQVAVIVCADNGVVSQGVSQVGCEVTLQVAQMLGKGISTANTLGIKTGVKVLPVDIGIDCEGEIPGVLDLKVRQGTRNFVLEPAMTEAEALMAIGAGIDLMKDLADEDTDIVLTGEMGIGNTTTAAALMAMLTGGDGSEYVGRGAGLGDEGLQRKLAVVTGAVSKYRKEQESLGVSGAESSFASLCQVGGLDIAALCGLYIGGALYGVPVVVDGLITAVAALLAERLVPGVSEYMIMAHAGREKGITEVADLLGLRPLMNGNMALGEGTGAIMAMPLLDTALDFYNRASTFGDGGIKEYQRFS